MYTCHKFASNLSTIREMKKLTLAEFSQELHVAKSALQDILNKDGDTTLYTALHIANQLGLPLSSLTGEEYSEVQPKLLLSIMTCFDSFARLSAEDQKDVVFHVKAILEKFWK